MTGEIADSIKQVLKVITAEMHKHFIIVFEYFTEHHYLVSKTTGLNTETLTMTSALKA